LNDFSAAVKGAAFAPGSSTEIISSSNVKEEGLRGRQKGGSTKILGVSRHSSNLISRMQSTKKTPNSNHPALSHQSSSISSMTHEHTTEMNTARNFSEEMISHSSSKTPEKEHMIGPLTEAQRIEKVLRYLEKKRNKSTMKKFCYKCRKQVAEKRLRIKGRFVTRQ